MEQLNFITNLLGIKDKNIKILDYLDAGTHKEVIAKLDYPASKCLNCQGQMAKYDFQKESKIPYLECAGYKTLIRLRKRRFRCKDCGKHTKISSEEISDGREYSLLFLYVKVVVSCKVVGLYGARRRLTNWQDTLF